MNNDLFDYLVANDKMDEFLGYELPQDVKDEITEIAQDYLNKKITYIEVENYLKNLSLTKQISLDLLQKSFEEQIK